MGGKADAPRVIRQHRIAFLEALSPGVHGGQVSVKAGQAGVGGFQGDSCKMLITICSDVHDNIWKLADALPGMNDGDVLLFCGDFCAPFTLDQMARGFDGPVHAVLGNNDGDVLLLCQVANGLDNVTLHGPFALLELEGRRIALVHYPKSRDRIRLSADCA